MKLGASAPGKALLCGEYAVLEGAPAIVGAVERRAFFRWADAPGGLSLEAEAALRAAAGRLGEVERAGKLDVTELQQDGTKLGLGSSAAAAVAAVGAVFDWHGHDPTQPTVRSQVFEVAMHGHESVAPRGSGVDVAAATYGGYLWFERSEHGAVCRPIVAPESMLVRLVWTGHAARTSGLLDAVHRLRDRDPSEYERKMRELHEGANRFASAFERGLTSEVVAEAIGYGRAMESLGKAAHAPIVESRLRQLMELAERSGGAAKPSGAGGGDVAVALFDDAAALTEFEAAARAADLVVVDAAWGAEGVRGERA